MIILRKLGLSVILILGVPADYLTERRSRGLEGFVSIPLEDLVSKGFELCLLNIFSLDSLKVTCKKSFWANANKSSYFS